MNFSTVYKLILAVLCADWLISLTVRILILSIIRIIILNIILFYKSNIIVPIFYYIVSIFVPYLKYSEEYFTVLCLIFFSTIFFTLICKFIVLVSFPQNNLIFKLFRTNIFTNIFTVDLASKVVKLIKNYFKIIENIFSHFFTVLIDKTIVYCVENIDRLIILYVSFHEVINCLRCIITNFIGTFSTKKVFQIFIINLFYSSLKNLRIENFYHAS